MPDQRLGLLGTDKPLPSHSKPDGLLSHEEVDAVNLIRAGQWVELIEFATKKLRAPRKKG